MAKDKVKVKGKVGSKQGNAVANERALGRVFTPEGANAGNALINKFLPQGALGRVDTNVPGATETLRRYDDLAGKYGSRDPIQSDVLNRMQAGLGGYTSQQYQGQREQMMRGLNSNLQTSLGQLAKAQARGKVYGAAASAQHSNALRGAEDSKNQLEQDLMVKNIDEQQRRLGEYGKYAGDLTESEYNRQAAINNDRTTQTNNLGQAELDRQKINLGQANAEIAGRIGLYTGAGGMGYQKAQARAMRKIQKQGIRAMGG